MKFSELITKVFTSEDISLIQGIEKKLRSRRKKERNGIYLLGAAILFGMVRQLAGEEVFIWDNFKNFWNFFVLIFNGDWAQAFSYEPVWELLVIGIISTFLLFYFLLIRTRFLEIESEEPFRYTFWVNSFDEVADTPPKNLFTLDRNDRFKLLHHDLMERLNSRIKRLSLLKLDELTSDNSKTDPSYFEPARDLQSKLVAHIQIGGVYSIREEKDHDWVIHVMPTVRIGSRGNPSILGYSVKFPLEKDNKLTASQYNQFIERVYSSVATELYKQIELDVQEKIKLFPTSRLRAVALFNEAKDFARSNTIDAYDRAITLYREALRYFEISQIRPITDFLIKRSFIWRFKVKPVYLQAKIQIGFIKCLIYRRIISALTGRYINPLFEIRPIIDEMIDRLPQLHDHFRKRSMDPLPTFFTFPKDSWIRHKLRFIIPSESSFEKRSQILFDAYLVAALGYFYLGSYLKAPDYLNTAKSINPKLSDRNPIFLMTAGLLEPDLDESILLLRQATETAPDFQIAQYLLAERSDMVFRMKNEITASRVISVTKEYDKVLSINPGNVAAHAAQGHLWWLVGDLQSAKKKFKEGCELKSIAADTFVGELTYGLARIAAEEGRFNDAYELFHQAISADPGIATCFPSTINVTFYSQMVPKILGRYQSFKGRVKNHHRRKMRGKINFDVKDLKDPIGVAVKFKYAKDDRHDIPKDDKNVITTENDKNAVHDKNAIYAYVKEKFNGKTKTLLEELDDCSEPCTELSIALVGELNRVLKCKTFYDKNRFEEIILSEEARRLIRQNPNNEKLCRLNRLLLEEVFPDELTRHEDVNKSTIDTVLSHVLNDYGNACLGYYARFGEVFRHEIAMKTFSKAVGLARENVIARFNQYLGYTWKGGINKQLDPLDNIQEVLLKYPNQKVIVFTLAQSILREPEEIREKKKEIEEYKRRRTSVIGKPDTQEKQVDTAGKVPDLGGTDKNPSIDYEGIKQLEADLEVLKESWSRSVENVKDLSIKNSKFSSLFDPSLPKYETFKPILGKLNDFFSSSKISSERLNEHDVRALTVLCQYLLMNDMLKVDIREIEPIFQNILALFWPEDFDIDTILERYKEHPDTTTIERRKSHINYWLRQDPVHYFNLTWLDPKYFGNNMPEGIRTQLTRAETELSRLDPKNASYWNMLANVYYSFKEYEIAVNSFTIATNLDDQNALYFNNLGNTYYNLANWKEAIEPFRKATELDTGNASYFNNLGNAYYGYEDYKNALVNYKRAKDLKEDVAVYHSNLGLAYYNLENWKEAIEGFRKATALDDGNASYFNNLGNAYYGFEDYTNALRSYEKAKDLRPDVAAYQSNIGLAYYNLENWKEAIDAFSKATDLDNGNASYFNDLGNAYYRSNDYQNALPNYKKAKNLKPDVAVYHSNFGLAYYKLENWKEAIDAFSKATMLDSGNASYCNNLGNAYYGNRDYRNALVNYEKAKSIKPDVAVYYTNIGLANNELKDWKSAIEAFGKATAIDPENATTFNDLGDAYYKSALASVDGKMLDYNKAAEQYLKAFEIDPTNYIYTQSLITVSGLILPLAEGISYIEKALLIAPDNMFLKDELKYRNSSV